MKLLIILTSSLAPQQVDVLRAALQQAVELWSRFGRDQREASLLTTRMQCSLRNPPLFSLRQTEGHLDFLQVSERAKNGLSGLAVTITPKVSLMCSCWTKRAGKWENFGHPWTPPIRDLSAPSMVEQLSFCRVRWKRSLNGQKPTLNYLYIKTLNCHIFQTMSPRGVCAAFCRANAFSKIAVA